MADFKATQIIDSDGSSVDIKINSHTGTKEMAVLLEGHVCAENSTSTPLGISETYTGEWQDTINYSSIVIGVNTDQNSATDGLEIQWSADGTTVHDTDNFTILANHGKTFSFGPARRYFRIEYTNGGVAQTTFNIESMIKPTQPKPSSHRILDTIVGDDDAQLVKSVLTGLGDDNVFRNASLSNSNRLKTVSQPYTFAVAEGDIPNHTALLKFGTRSAIAAGVQSLIWEGTNAQYTYLTSAEQLKVSSSSVQDDPTGTGIFTLTILGLDANYDEISETITMDGTSVVTTVNSYIRIFRAYGATCGTSLTNVGNITITNNAGTNQLVYIPAGDGQTLMTLWTVPNGKRLFITGISTSTDTNKGAKFSLFTRPLDGGTLYPWRIRYRSYLFSGSDNFPFMIPFEIPEKTDIEIRFTTPASAGTTSGGATFEGWYELE